MWHHTGPAYPIISRVCSSRDFGDMYAKPVKD